LLNNSRYNKSINGERRKRVVSNVRHLKLGDIMTSAIISTVFGILAFLIPIPIIVPVLGAALGANSYLKENKKVAEGQNKKSKAVSIIGVVICSFAVILFFINRSL